MLKSKRESGFIVPLAVIAIVIVVIIVIANVSSGNKNNVDKSDPAETQQTTSVDSERETRVREAIESAKDGKCSTDITIDSIDAGYNTLVEGAIRVFVNTGKEVFKSDKCSHYTLQYLVDSKSGDGSLVKSAIITAEASKDKFDSYDWTELEGTVVGQKLVDDEVLILSLPVQSEVDLNDITLTL